MLPACGGGSSSSAGAGGADSRTYQQGYAAGTVATLDIVLEDLRAVQTSLAGSGAPAQTSRGTLGRSFASLEPRQRSALAASLLTFIERVAAARTAAAAPTAGRTEAEAAQEAADDALRALQLVITADTADRAGGDEQVQAAAIAALNQITRVDVTAPDARAQVDAALNNALQAAQNQVAELERALAAAQAAAARAGQTAGTAVETITGLQASLTTARNSLNALTARFGASPAGPSVRTAGTAYHARRTGATIWFDLDGTAPDFDATGGWNSGTRYHLASRGTAVTDGFDLTPEAVLYTPGGSNPRVFAATNPNTSHFPGRGVVFRGALRYQLDETVSARTRNRANNHPTQWLYGRDQRLVVQGEDPEPCTGAYDVDTNPGGCAGSIADGKFGATGSNAAVWNNWDSPASMTFQHKSSGGFTIGFGGEGVIFGDLERYVARGLGGGSSATTCSGGGGSSGTAPAGEYCDDATTANVEISFGTPQADPYGEPDTNYWNVRAPSPRLPGNSAADSAGDAVSFDLTQPGGQVAGHDMGRYELLLSNYAGADRRLAYAAYGLFNFIDHTTTAHRYGRMQIFHYGLDAFANSDGRKTTDLAQQGRFGERVEGTFRGKTMAWVVTSKTKKQEGGRFNGIENLFRMRGDITLTACIGAYCPFGAGLSDDQAVNTIKGTIANLEYAFGNKPGGYWTTEDGGGIEGAGELRGKEDVNGDFREGVIELQAANIGVDGKYEGVANPRWIDGLDPGSYEGAFYGPVGAGLETAGTWRVNASPWEHRILSMDAIIGSFGAVCEGTCKPSLSP